ncbi:MAG: hypothetical protein SCI25_08540 [Desulfuromonadales bacterium]|nr:hypothetical protein [Desulfuromonadales bacterium]MDW7757918.1 hypothetical protein [Desulfuromonadales bacterium]
MAKLGADFLHQVHLVLFIQLGDVAKLPFWYKGHADPQRKMKGRQRRDLHRFTLVGIEVLNDAAGVMALGSDHTPAKNESHNNQGRQYPT